VILMVVGRIGFVAHQENHAYEDLLDCSIVVLVQMEAEAVTVLPCHYLASWGSEQVGLEVVVLVVRPASQLDSDHQIHVAPEPVPSCTFDRS
jgi:hypothetical protein